MPNNLKAWERIGVRPFTRCVYWQLLEEEERAAKAVTGAKLNFAAAKKVAFGTGEEEDEDGENDAEDDEEEDPSLKKAHVLSSAQVWDKGPLTADETREIVAENTEEILTKRKSAQDKKEENDRKKRAKHIGMAIEGARILERLADDDDDEFNDVTALTVPQLKAVIIAAGLDIPSGALKPELVEFVVAAGF